MSKLFLALIDGMRPDALTALNHPFFQELCRSSRYSLDMRTVMPSVTLPCHMSLFHSVTPERHGIITNTYVPQVRPVKGLCEVLNDAGKSCASFYTWEPLRDLSRPLSLAHSTFFSGRRYTYQVADAMVTDAAEKMFAAGTEPDFYGNLSCLFYFSGIERHIAGTLGRSEKIYYPTNRLLRRCGVDSVAIVLSYRN